MIACLSKIITDFFIRFEVIDENEKEIYQYGNEIVISTSIDILILLILGIVFNDFSSVIVFWICFYFIRKFSGGYHADTYLKCKFVFLANVFTVLMLINFMLNIYSAYLFAFTTFFTYVVVFSLAPVQNANKPLSVNEKCICAIKSKVLLIVASLLSVILFFFAKKISFAILLAYFSVAIAMMFEYFRKEDLSNENS